jgi:hypothetical protein
MQIIESIIGIIFVIALFIPVYIAFICVRVSYKGFKSGREKIKAVRKYVSSDKSDNEDDGVGVIEKKRMEVSKEMHRQSDSQSKMFAEGMFIPAEMDETDSDDDDDEEGEAAERNSTVAETKSIGFTCTNALGNIHKYNLKVVYVMNQKYLPTLLRDINEYNETTIFTNLDKSVTSKIDKLITCIAMEIVLRYDRAGEVVLENKKFHGVFEKDPAGEALLGMLSSCYAFDVTKMEISRKAVIKRAKDSVSEMTSPKSTLIMPNVTNNSN